MIIFHKTTHLSEILEKSESDKVIIFIHSSKCYQSDKVKEHIEGAVLANKIKNLVFLVVVQDHPVLSKKIEDNFGVKHESPQLLVVQNGKVLQTLNHDEIKLKDIAI